MSSNMAISNGKPDVMRTVSLPAPGEGLPSNGAKPAVVRLPNVKSVKELVKAEKQGRDIPISEKQLIHAIERAIKAMQGSPTSLEFSVHEVTKRIIVKVKNEETGEIVREIPPEKTEDLLAKLWEMAGLLVDERR